MSRDLSFAPSFISSDLLKRAATAVVLAGLGGFLVVGAGLAQTNALHEAAHDARHALGFPCH